MLWELVKRRSNRQKNTVKITPREARQCHVECYLHTSSIHLTGPPGAAAAERSSHIFCAWVQVQRPRKIIAQTITASVPTPGCARWSRSLRGKSEPSLACCLLFSRSIQSTPHPAVLWNGCGAEKRCVFWQPRSWGLSTRPSERISTWIPRLRFESVIRQVADLSTLEVEALLWSLPKLYMHISSSQSNCLVFTFFPLFKKIMFHVSKWHLKLFNLLQHPKITLKHHRPTKGHLS